MEIRYTDGAFSAKDLAAHLVFTGAAPAIFRQMIRQREAAKQARAWGLTATEEQVQAFADQFRTDRDLLSAGQMMEFLRRAGLSEDDFGDYCETAVLAALAGTRIVDDAAMQRYFLEHRQEFDSADVSIITVGDEGLAKEIVMRIREDGEDFGDLAASYSMDETTGQPGCYAGRIRRERFEADVSAKVFNAGSGDVLGPFPADAGFQVIRVEAVARAGLEDEDTRAAVREKVIEEWVEQFVKDGVSVTP